MENTNENKASQMGDNLSKNKPISGTQKSDFDETRILISQLTRLFEEELKDIHWAEEALVKAMPKLIKNARTPDLRDAISNHLTETENQVRRIEQVFEILGKKVSSKRCEAMEGLIKEADEIMRTCDEGIMRDEGIIAAAQKVEHYEISTYGTLHQIAETLGLVKAVKLIQSTLDEEKAADRKLTEIAIRIANKQNIHAN